MFVKRAHVTEVDLPLCFRLRSLPWGCELPGGAFATLVVDMDTVRALSPGHQSSLLFLGVEKLSPAMGKKRQRKQGKTT